MQEQLDSLYELQELIRERVTWHRSQRTCLLCLGSQIRRSKSLHAPFHPLAVHPAVFGQLTPKQKRGLSAARKGSITIPHKSQLRSGTHLKNCSEFLFRVWDSPSFSFSQPPEILRDFFDIFSERRKIRNCDAKIKNAKLEIRKFLRFLSQIDCCHRKSHPIQFSESF